MVNIQNVSANVRPLTASVIPTLQAAGALLTSAFDVVKFEIFRDFFQIISLFFAGLSQRLPESFKTFWGNIADFFALCWSCWVADLTSNRTFTQVMFFVKVIPTLIFAIIFIYRYRKHEPDDDVQGLDVKKWGSRSKNAYRFAMFLSLWLTTLYLPVARDCLMVFACDLYFVKTPDDCYNGTHSFMMFLAVMSCLLFLIPIPIVFYLIIQRNKPKPVSTPLSVGCVCL